MRKFLAAAVAVSLIAGGGIAAAGPNEWPQFRGPGGAGIADESTLPERWSAADNVAWAVEVPGRGWSSPIVWRDRVIVTTAVSAGAFKAPSTGIFGNDYAAELQKQGLSDDEIVKRVVSRDIELSDEGGDISYVVLAIDRQTGRTLWQREAHRGKPAGGRHRKNTYASETPATDGERIYASFGGNVGVFCYSMDGALLWSHTWAPQKIYLDFGTASSPVVHKGRVYQLHDNDGESFLAALEAKTGKELWRVKRADLAARLASGWATPLIWEHGERTEIVTIGRGFVISYDTEGRELWRLKGMTQATPSPVVADGLLYVGSGSQGEANRPLLAIRPGASGDITPKETETNSPFVAWRLPRFSGYTPSPLVYRGRIYAINDNGVLQVADAKTGTEVYKARMGGGGRTFSSSPLASQGRVYCLSEDGEAIVLRAGDRYDEIARNALGEMSLASPAADTDSLYVRTQTKLYRLREPGPAQRGAAQPAPAPAPRKKLLVIGEEKGYRHEAVTHAMTTIVALGRTSGLWDTMIRTDTEALTKKKLEYNAKTLNDFDAVLFYTGGTLEMDDEQMASLMSFVRDEGKGFIGVHSAAITFTKWPEFGEMLGGWYDEHPWNTFAAPIVVEDATFPGMSAWPSTFTLTDEIYQVKAFSRANSRVLMRLDASKLDLANPRVHRADRDFAVAWAKMHGRGRVFYTTLGHVEANWDKPEMQAFMTGAIKWALGLVDADVTPRPAP